MDKKTSYIMSMLCKGSNELIGAAVPHLDCLIQTTRVQLAIVSLNSLHIEPVSEKSLKGIYLKGKLLFTNTNTRSGYINHTREP
jgi:hypothetical protein